MNTYFLSTGCFEKSSIETVLNSYKGFENRVVFSIWKKDYNKNLFSNFKHVILNDPLEDDPSILLNSCNYQLKLIKSGLNYIESISDCEIIIKTRNDIECSNILSFVKYVFDFKQESKFMVLSFLKNITNYYTDFVMCGLKNTFYNFFTNKEYATYNEFPELFFINKKSNQKNTINDLKDILYFMKDDLKKNDIEFFWYRVGGITIKLIEDYCCSNKKVGSEKAISIENNKYLLLTSDTDFVTTLVYIYKAYVYCIQNSTTLVIQNKELKSIFKICTSNIAWSDTNTSCAGASTYNVNKTCVLREGDEWNFYKGLKLFKLKENLYSNYKEKFNSIPQEYFGCINPKESSEIPSDVCVYFSNKSNICKPNLNWISFEDLTNESFKCAILDLVLLSSSKAIIRDDNSFYSKAVKIVHEHNYLPYNPVKRFNPQLTVNVSFWGYSDENIILRESKLNYMMTEKESKLNFIFGEKNSDNANLSVIINFPSPNFIHTPKKTIVFNNEPTLFAPNDFLKGPKNICPEYFSNIYPHNFLKVEGACGNSLGMVQWMFDIDPITFKTLSFTKSKNMACIVSNKNFDEGHIQRRNFVKEYGAKLNLDVFGRCTELAFKGPLRDDEKWFGYAPYKYFLSMENNRENNYITEKLFEPILCECLTFYSGAPNVSSFIDPNCYIFIDPVNNGLENTFKTIRDAIENKEWEKRIGYIREMKMKILNELSFFPRVKNIIYNETFVFLKGVDQLNFDLHFEQNIQRSKLYSSNQIMEKLTLASHGVAFNTYNFIKKDLKFLNFTHDPEAGLYVSFNKLISFINDYPLFFDNEKEKEFYHKYKGRVGYIPFGWSNKKVTKNDVLNYLIPIVSIVNFLHGEDIRKFSYCDTFDNSDVMDYVKNNLKIVISKNNDN